MDGEAQEKKLMTILQEKMKKRAMEIRRPTEANRERSMY
jgi:hypothetical protein